LLKHYKRYEQRGEEITHMSTFPYGIEDSKQVGFNCGHAYIVGGRPPLSPEQQVLVAKDLAEGCCATPEAAFAFIQSFQEGYRARIEAPLVRIIAKYAALLEGYWNIEDFPLEGHQIMQGVLGGLKASVSADKIVFNRDVNMQHMDPEYFERVRWIWDEAIAAIQAQEAYGKQSEEEGGPEAKESSGGRQGGEPEKTAQETYLLDLGNGYSLRCVYDEAAKMAFLCGCDAGGCVIKYGYWDYEELLEASDSAPERVLGGLLRAGVSPLDGKAVVQVVQGFLEDPPGHHFKWCPLFF
jgi:hypothetical protein